MLRHLRRLIDAGAPGAQLASSRQVGRDLGVGPVTVQRALDRLRAEGRIETRPGIGTFVADDRVPTPATNPAWQTAVLGAPAFDPEPLRQLTPAHRRGIVLSSGYLDADLQAGTALTAAAQRAMRRAHAWDHTTLGGDTDLRAWFAAGIGGGRVADDVVVAPGGQAALASTFRALARPGAAVVVESPTYPGALLAARAAGLRLLPWQSEPQPDPLVLDDVLAASGAQLVYAQSRFANPTGQSWDERLRRDVLAVLRRRRAFLIDDDWAADLTLEGPAAPSLAELDPDGHVVTVRSLTKLLAPGLRIAAVAGRGPVVRRLAGMRLLDDVAVSGLLERTAVELVTSTAWARHLRRLRATLLARRDALLDAVTDWLGDDACAVPLGGLHLWMQLPPPLEADALAAAADHAGVTITSGTRWYPGEAPAQRVRLSYSAAEPAQLVEGVSILRKLAPR